MTQNQKILTIMCRQPDKWFYPYEFMMPELGDLFVGYKAPTRIAELHKAYPRVFNSRTVGKYVQRKINTEVLWFDDLPEDLQKIVHNENAEMFRRSTPTTYSNLKAISWLEDEEEDERN